MSAEELICDEELEGIFRAYRDDDPTKNPKKRELTPIDLCAPTPQVAAVLEAEKDAPRAQAAQVDRLLTVEGEVASMLAHQESKRRRALAHARDRLITDREILDTPVAIIRLDNIMFQFFEILPSSSLLAQYKGRFLTKRLKQLNKTALPYSEVDKIIKRELADVTKTLMDGHIVLALWYASCYCGLDVTPTGWAE